MNRSESAGSASFRNPSRQIQSANIPYFDANTNFMYNSQARPKSDRSFDESSVQSYGAVEGSLRNSMVSILSNSKKSQKSYMSNYPPIKIKQFPKNDRKHPDLTSGKNNEHKRSTNSVKSNEETNIKKRKAEYYVDEDYFYSSQFKRNFVKGMLTLAKNKNISDLSLLLREVAPTIMVKSEDTSIWVSAYLLIFKIEFQMRKVKLNEQVLSELLQDELVDYMLKNRQAKKARIIKILIYVFKEIPIFKPKVVQWFEQFIKKNKERLRSIDLSKYIDLNQINTRIDFANINKSANIKAKQIDKQRQKEKRKQMVRFKQQMVQKREIVQQRPKSRASQFRNESRTQRRSQKSVEIPRQTPRQTPKQNLKQTIKQTPRQIPKQTPRQTPRQRIQNKNIQNDQVVRLSGSRQEILLKKQKNERKNQENVPKQSKNQTIQNKIVPNSSENKSLGAQNIKSNIPVKKEDKNQQPPQNKLSLQQMIARRIQGAFPPSEKNKIKKSQGSIKQNKQKKDSVNNEKLLRQRKEQEKRKIEVENERKNQQALQQKNEKLKERIKLLAKNRQEQLKSQVQQPEIYPENPKPKKQNYELPSAYNSFQPYSSANQYSFLEDISGIKNNGRNKRDNRINVNNKKFSNQNYEDHSQSNQNSNDSLDSCVAIQNENEGESYDQDNMYKNYQLNEEDLELNADENQLQGSQEAEEFDQEDYQNYGNF